VQPAVGGRELMRRRTATFAASGTTSRVDTVL